jgi:predicted metalloprotease with PDZ domain
MPWLYRGAVLASTGTVKQGARMRNLGLLFVFLFASAAWAAPAVEYTLRFPHRAQHYVEVEAKVPSEGKAQVDLMLPVWTPGSYLVRDYSRHLEALTIDGKDSAERVAKNRWRVPTQGKATVTVRYRIYSRLLTVRTNFVDQEFALIAGASTFLTPLDHDRRYVVRIERPKGWTKTITGLPASGTDRFTAGNYDQLVDSPLLIGDPRVTVFKVAGKPHVMADQGAGPQWDSAQAVKDVTKIIEVQQKFWGSLPYSKYSFINLLQQRGGGLEHLNSTVLMGSRFAQRDRKAYVGWLRLVAHEFFHTWNVKRLRPVELGPFDYERENHTRSLWIAEGITSYYDVLTVRRAGLSTDKELLEGLSKKIERVQTTAGRAVRSLEDASYDAWIKFYKADENTRNVAPSYYVKGSVVAFLLDLEIRRATADKKSLDDVMRAAYAQYSGAKGFTPAQFIAVTNAVTGKDLSAFFEKYTAGTAELDYGPALAWLGLRFKPKKAAKSSKTPAPQARVAGCQDRRQPWPAGGQARAPRDACACHRAERGRRDFGHRRRAHSARAVRETSEAVPSGREGHAACRTKRSAGAPARHVCGETRSQLDHRSRSQSHPRAKDPLRGVDHPDCSPIRSPSWPTSSSLAPTAASASNSPGSSSPAAIRSSRRCARAALNSTPWVCASRPTST